MMVGMMTPSAAPMILIYARLGRQASVEDKPFAATGWFAAGYLVAWTGSRWLRRSPSGRSTARLCLIRR